MSISYEQGGRVRQKERTRRDLIGAARKLIAQGEVPSVEEAASAASVSRATAYRYFKNQQELLIAAHPEVEQSSLLGDHPPADVEERLDRVVRGLAEMIFDSEEAYRMTLRLALELDGPDRRNLVLRKGLRLKWIGEALEPIRGRMPARQYERLLLAICATVGIESLVVLTDMAGRSRTQATQIVRWSARALLRTALAESVDVS